MYTEEEPLLGSLSKQDDGARQRAIGLDPKPNEDDPRERPASYKWGIVILLALMAFTV